MNEQLRLFASIELPADLRDALARTQRQLQSALPEGVVRWTNPAQLHLTLRFLGKVEATRIAALVDSLREHCTGIPPVPLRAEGIGFFPNPRRPRIIWAGVHDLTGLLKKLHQAVQKATSDFSSEPPEESFVGHVTFGRIKHLNREETRMLVGAAAENSCRQVGEWLATSIELMKSEPSSTGAHHLSVATIPLG